MTRLIGAALAALLATGTANALEVTETVNLPSDPAVLWERIGAFCAIADWHAAVLACDESEADGAVRRTLTLEGGGTLLEERTAEGEMMYSYAILEGPLPVADYEATLSAEATEDGTLMTWRGTFEAKDADDATAIETIQSIYRSGLVSIAEMAKDQ